MDMQETEELFSVLENGELPASSLTALDLNSTKNAVRPANFLFTMQDSSLSFQKYRNLMKPRMENQSL